MSVNTIWDYENDKLSSTEKGIEEIKRFVKENPYPDYDWWEKFLESQMPMTFNIIAEYGEYNHTLCKIMYDNITDEKIVKNCAKKIVARGGLQALSMNWYPIYYHFKLNCVGREDEMEYTPKCNLFTWFEEEFEEEGWLN